MTTKKIDKKKAYIIGIISASIVALTAAYFFFGPKGKKNQAEVKKWILKIKKEIVEKMKRAKAISKPVYDKIVDTVVARYKKELKASQKEAQGLAKDLKDHWEVISHLTETLEPMTKKRASKR